MYKMVSDRGGAPCAPEPRQGSLPLLTLSLCKPAIRRTAEAGDRLVALTSRALQQRDGYPEAAVIYAATVSEAVDARTYYSTRSRFRSRPDCVYVFSPEEGVFRHTGNTPLHANPESEAKDLGRFPFYRNGRVLLCREFRYFGAGAPVIAAELPKLRHVAEVLGQGHRVFRNGDDPAMDAELDRLFRTLLRQETRFTPREVAADSYERRAFATARELRDAGASRKGGEGRRVMLRVAGKNPL